MRNAFLPLLAAALLAWNASASAALPAALLAPPSSAVRFVNTIPDGYFEPVSLDVASWFAQAARSRHRLVLPRLGSLAVIHDRTVPIDPARAVLRWEGHLEADDTLKVTFVKALSGMVSGVIDTPAGPVLLGQAGDYIVYKQSRAEAPATGADEAALPEVLVPQPRADAAGKPAAAAWPVQFNAAALARLPLNGEATLSLPGAGDFRVVHDNELAGDLGATTFVGYLKDFGDDFRVTVTYSPAGAQGQILTPYGLFLLRTVGERQWLIDVAGSGLKTPPPSVDDGIRRPGAAALAAAQDATAPADLPAGRTTTAAATRIDVLVLYTPGLVSAYGGTAQALTEIQQLAAFANQAYADSGVAIVLRVVGAVEIAAADDTVDLDALRALTDGAAPYDNVAWLRSQYGADLVSLVRPFSAAQERICGTAWVGGNGRALAQSGDLAFSVVGDGYDGGYYCPAHTFVHELSHNMGSAHDRAAVAAQSGTAGAYSYSYGYGIAGQFGTVMSYVEPHVGKFSNPRITCPGTVPCGIAASDSAHSADNALSLDNARTIVAAFTPEAATQTVSVAGIVAADGEALAGVQLTASPAAPCSRSGSNGSFACLLPSGWTGTLTPTLAGYTFSPPALSLDHVTASRADQSFTAVRGNAAGVSATAAPVSGGNGGGGAADVVVVLSMVALSRWRGRRRGPMGRVL